MATTILYVHKHLCAFVQVLYAKGMKKVLLGSLFVALVVPVAVRAVTAEELRAQIQALLAQIAALQQQTQQYAPTTPTTPTYQPTNPYTTTTNTTGTFQYSRCPDLQYNLERGMRDADVAVEVTMLQRFLAQDSQLYPEGEVTGYFGPATERAVQKFQIRHGIVSYGDYQATGYGRVGPRTRWAIKNSCGGSSSTTVAVDPVTITPTTGVSPLQVTVSFTGKGSNCSSYLIDWGDGTAPASYNAPTPSECANDTFNRRATHTYAQGGVFNLSFRIGNTTAALAPLIKTAQIYVTAGAPTTTVTYLPVTTGSGTATTTPTTTDFSSCFVSPTTGAAPLAARARVILGGSLCDGQFSYQVDWGDGALSESRYCNSTAGHYDTFMHTYSTNGTYTARLLQQHPQARFAEESCAVTVSSNTTGTTGTYNQVAPPTCLQWYDGCNNCSRTYAYGPAVCTQRYCTQYTALSCYQYASGTNTNTGTIQNDSIGVSSRSSGNTAETITFNVLINGARSCDGGLYTVDFGDGTYDQQPYPADACRAFERPVSHTYTANGVYTVRLIKNSVTQATTQVQVSSIVANLLNRNVASAFQAVVNLIESFIR